MWKSYKICRALEITKINVKSRKRSTPSLVILLHHIDFDLFEVCEYFIECVMYCGPKRKKNNIKNGRRIELSTVAPLNVISGIDVTRTISLCFVCSVFVIFHRFGSEEVLFVCSVSNKLFFTVVSESEFYLSLSKTKLLKIVFNFVKVIWVCWYTVGAKKIVRWKQKTKEKTTHKAKKK